MCVWLIHDYSWLAVVYCVCRNPVKWRSVPLGEGAEDFQSPLTIKSEGGIARPKKPRKTFKWSPKLK